MTAPNPSDLRPAAFVFVDDLAVPVPADADQHHLARVLRLRSGEVVVAADGAGGWRPCVVVSAAGREVRLEPTGDLAATGAPAPTVTIGFALTKGDRPEWVVQKLTELGVDRIVPVAAARSIVRWDEERATRHHERLVAVAREASMQSRRARLPTVERPSPLEAALTVCGPAALCEAGAAAAPSLDRPALFVGPEGGWSDDELRLAAAPVGLGPTTLRAETATIAAGVLLCALRSATVRANDVS
jgi:16S rRNA (uracil1498-N3)-methyltransferase